MDLTIKDLLEVFEVYIWGPRTLNPKNPWFRVAGSEIRLDMARTSSEGLVQGLGNTQQNSLGAYQTNPRRTWQVEGLRVSGLKKFRIFW